MTKERKKGKLYDEKKIQNYIQAAIERETFKHKTIKKYE